MASWRNTALIGAATLIVDVALIIPTPGFDLPAAQAAGLALIALVPALALSVAGLATRNLLIQAALAIGLMIVVTNANAWMLILLDPAIAPPESMDDAADKAHAMLLILSYQIGFPLLGGYWLVLAGWRFAEWRGRRQADQPAHETLPLIERRLPELRI
jgi:hypothetical protein